MNGFSAGDGTKRKYLYYIMYITYAYECNDVFIPFQVN